MRLRDLPSVDELARGLNDPLAVEAARNVLARAREEISAGFEPGDLAGRVEAELAGMRKPSLRRVVNATGVIVHTNLGRGPLGGGGRRARAGAHGRGRRVLLEPRVRRERGNAGVPARPRGSPPA